MLKQDFEDQEKSVKKVFKDIKHTKIIHEKEKYELSLKIREQNSLLKKHKRLVSDKDS